MTDFLVVGTDTDAGKTTFALHWMTAFTHDYAYWKPVETGQSDSETLRRLVPNARVFDPIMRLSEPVAPSLAARLEGRTIPLATEIVQRKPPSDCPLLIETFGGPLSPLNESELQIELVRGLGLPCVLVSLSSLGAITRSLTTLRYLRSEEIDVRAVVLVGPADEYAVEQIALHGSIQVVELHLPSEWTVEGLQSSANEQKRMLDVIRELLGDSSPRPLPPGPPLRNGERGETLLFRDSQHVWHPYTPLRGADEPLPVVAAQNEFLELADGRRLIDGISSWWTILHGHRVPRLMQALREASERIDHVLFAGVTHPYAVECAERLLKTTPWQGGRMFFSDNGSTAVEVALKMAYQFWCHRGEPQRRLFVGFEDGYHGDTFGAMAVGRDPLFFGRFEPLLFKAERVPVDPNRLDELLARKHSEVAAVIIEPLVQGAGGMRMHSPEVLRQLHEVCQRHDVLFIADEVMTAGRTGTWWAHTQAGIEPDLICCSKTLAGGVLPLAATLVAPKIVVEFDVADREKTFFHGHSFTAHPLACAVAVENLRLLSEGNWLNESRRIQSRWERASQELSKLPGVSDARVCGTILAIDVGHSGGYLAENGREMRRIAIENKVLLRPLGNVLYALPPLGTSDQSLDQIVSTMTRAANGAVTA